MGILDRASPAVACRRRSGFAAAAAAMCLCIAAAGGIGRSESLADEPLYVAPPGESFELVLPAPLTPFGAAVPPAVCPASSHNCNFALRATEDFANRIIARCQTQDGPVRDCILGADVFGNQSTTTATRLNFRPCETAARFELEVAGDVDSRTVGVTRQAQIQTRGRHQFLLAKEIEFDGAMVRTRSPSVTVAPQQRHVGAQTIASGVPVIGPWAEGIALQQAAARDPLAAQITAERITRQAAPEFNRRVDAELGRLNDWLSGPSRRTLEQWRLVPGAQSVATTEHDLLWRVTLDVATPPPPFQPAADFSARAGALYLHDSLVNDLLDRLPLGGVGVPDAAIDRWFQALGSGEGLAALSRGGGTVAPRLATIVFDRRQPIRLRFSEERFELILRLGFTPVAGPAIDTQEITIPFTIEVAEDAVRFLPGEVQIAPGDPGAAGGVLDEAARALIRQQVQSRLESRTAPRVIPIDLPDAPRTQVQVRTVNFRDGWLSVEFD
jgi:hypothetical protein